MDKQYWLDRKRASLAMARDAVTSEARLIHYDLAGRYSVKAVQSGPFMIARSGPANAGERAALGLTPGGMPLTPSRGLA